MDKFMSNKLVTNLSRRLEVSEVLEAPQVVRDGKYVKAIQLDDNKVNALVEKLRPPPRVQVARVVTQSVPTGTMVQRGTVIDLTLLRPIDIRYELFGDVHPALQKLSVADIIQSMPIHIAEIVSSKEDSTTLDANEQLQVGSFLGEMGIQTGEGTGPQSFHAVYNLLVNTQVFK